MRSPHTSLSPEKMYEDYGYYLEVRLGAVPGLEEILAFFTDHQMRLDKSIQFYRLSRRSRQRAFAMRDGARYELDRMTRVLAFSILGQVRNNRDAPIYRFYFAEGIQAVMKTPLQTQRRLSQVIVSKLERETDSSLSIHLEPFRGALAVLEEAIRIHGEALDDEAAARSSLEKAKRRWIFGYRRTHIMLMDQFENDPRRAETFFRRAVKKAAVEEDEIDIPVATEAESREEESREEVHATG